MFILIELLILIIVVFLAARYFIRHAKGKKRPIHIYWIAGLFGLAVTIAGIYVEPAIIPSKLTAGGFSKDALIGALLTGLIEESFKFIPYAVFVYRKKYFSRNVDGVVLFAMVGLGSAFIEDVTYFLSGDPVSNTLRLLLILFHAATTATVGYFFIKVKLKHESYIKTILALLFVAMAHGLSDFSEGSGKTLLAVAGIGIAAAVIKLLFVVYKRAQQADGHSRKTIPS